MLSGLDVEAVIQNGISGILGRCAFESGIADADFPVVANS